MADRIHHARKPRTPRGTCTGCGRDRALTQDGLTRSHMHNGRRCPGMCQPPEPAPLAVTLRDLIRAARAAGAPLRREYHEPGATEYWQCWDDGARRRRALVRHWPATGGWRVEISAAHGLAVDHAIRVDMQNPTIAQIAAAARLCGWDLATVDRREPT